MGKTNAKWLDFGIEQTQIQASKLPVNYSPSNYTPSQVSSEGLDKLSAHLKGLDAALLSVILEQINYYDAGITITTDVGEAGAGYNADHTIFTLPEGQTYNGTTSELLVFVNGILYEDGIDFNYDNNTTATTVTFFSSLPKDTRVRFRKVQS
jgi:hypothetical protein